MFQCCLILAGSTNAIHAKPGQGAWGTGATVFGVARGHRRVTSTPSLMADMYGFMSKEEMEETKAYLKSHGNYQLEQVGK